MKQKPISLTYKCWGKEITTKHDSSVLRVPDLFRMFRSIIVSEFGEQEWNRMIMEISDDIQQPPQPVWTKIKGIFK